MSFDFDHDANFVERLRGLARDRPEQVALRFLGDGQNITESLCYGELDRLARAVAVELVARGGVGERALILLPGGPRYVSAFFGCLYAATLAVPAYPPQSLKPQHMKRLRAILADAAPRFVITSRELKEELAGLADSLGSKVELLAIEELEQAGREVRFCMPELARDAVAFLQYTSGSTDQPKGVMVGHDNLVANELSIRRAFAMREQDVVVSWLPLFHDMGLIGALLQPFFNGSSVVLIPTERFLFRPACWLEAVARFGGTVSGGPDFAYRLCTERVSEQGLAGLDLSGWRLAFSGSEPVREATLRAFVSKFSAAGFRESAVHPCYGLAEATLLVSGGTHGPSLRTLAVAGDALARGEVSELAGASPLVDCGAAQPAHEIVILDPQSGAELAPDAVGEICVTGPSVTHGYFRRPEETAQTFGERDGQRLLRTGDLGFLRDGRLFVTGRKKDLIIVRGRNLYPQDLEASVEAKIEFVRQGRVVAFGFEQDGRECIGIAAEVSPRVKSLINLDGLCALIREAVAEEHQESAAVVLLLQHGTLPRTSSGKLQRAALRRGFLEGTLTLVARSEEGGVAAVAPAELAPTTATERTLLALWKEVLGRELTRHDSVFAQGADSLSCAQVLGRLHEQLGVKLATTALFDAPSVAELAQVIDVRGAELSSPMLAIERADGVLEGPLSPTQRGLWLTAKLAGASSALHVPGALRFKGPLDRELLERALALVVQRHEALRSCFPERDGQPLQRIASERELPFARVDLSELGAEQREQRLTLLSREEAERPFELECGPLLRATYVKLCEHDHVLLVTVHHLVADGRSLDVLARELLASYAALRTGSELALPRLTLRYLDYARHHAAQLDAGERARQLGYWRERLAETPAVLALPADGEPTAAGAGRARFQLEAALLRELRKLARAQRTTLATVLLAAFDALLSRATGQSDLCIGVPFANRGRVELEPLIGLFVNTLPLRVEVAQHARFDALLQRVHGALREAEPCADVPFADVVAALSPERSRDRHPIFQVVFNHQRRVSTTRLASLGLSAESYARDAGTSQFELTLELLESEDALHGELVYARARYGAAGMERLARRFIALLTQLAAHPELPVAELVLLEADELAALDGFNRSAASQRPYLPLHAQISLQARQRPLSEALVCGSERMSYGELDRRANVLAQRLRVHGLQLEQRVALCIERSPAFLVAALAVLKAGGAFVPLDPAQPAVRLQTVLIDVGASLLLVRSRADLPSALPEQVRPLVLDEEHEGEREYSEAPAVMHHPEQLAYVIYTSGSSGMPKGVAVQHGALSAHIEGACALYELGASDTALHFAAFTFDAAIEQWAAPLSRGARLVLSTPELTGERTEALVARERITIIYPPTSHLLELARSVEQTDKQLGVRVCTVGGEAVSRESFALLRRTLDPELLINGYGPTEAVITPLLYRAARGVQVQTDYAPIGSPVGARAGYVLDAALNRLPVGVVGELYLGGPLLARGYLGRGELTAASFVPDPFSPEAGARMYRTGDLCRYLPDGTVEYLGRRDEQVKLRGFRIELGEVESALLAQPGVREAAVVLRKDGAAARLVGYVVAAVGQAISERVLLAALTERLPSYMVPARLVELAQLPRTAHGKLDRKALPTVELSARAYLAPNSRVERELAEIWSRLLAVESVSRQDDFFELGGDSILALQVVSRARQRGIELEPADLFRAPQLAALAECARARPLGTIAQGPAAGIAPWTPIQCELRERAKGLPSQFNQALALRAAAPLDHGALERALAALVQHHDALRLCYAGDPPVQAYGELASHEALLHTLEGASRERELAAIDALHASFDLTRAPLLRALALSGEGTRLVLIAHHLVVDGVSWRVLIEDLESAYAQACSDAEIELPPKTSSFAAWGARLEQLARTVSLSEELSYWEGMLAGAPPTQSNSVRCDERRVCSLRMNAEETAGLAEATAQARTEELLLLALSRAWSRWSGSDALLVDVERHGRDADWDELAGLDLSRTVGWFTARHPLYLRSFAEIGEGLLQLKQTLRTVPHAGLGYGLLKYLAEPSMRARMARLPEARVTFNYLGRLDTARAAGGQLTLEQTQVGTTRAPSLSLPSELVIDAQLRDGELYVDFEYDAQIACDQRMQRLLEEYRAQLREVVEHCRALPATLRTEELPLAGLSQAVLDLLALPADDVEDLYPLSPLQQGLLFHALSEPDSAAYVNQLAFDVEGLDLGAFAERVVRAAREQAALRTAFVVHPALEQPLQWVSRSATIELGVVEERSAVGRAERLEQLRREQHARGFDLTTPGLSRLLLVRLDDRHTHLIWTCHHLCLDGWSAARLLATLLSSSSANGAYAAPAHGYRDYVASLLQRDLTLSERFWTPRLRELEQPTQLASFLPVSHEGSGHALHKLVLTASESDWLRRAAQARKVTLSSALSAAWLLLLSRYTGQRVVSAGLTVSTRPAAQLSADEVLGLFINTVPLVYRLEPERSTHALLQGLQLESALLREHAEVPLYTLMKWAGRAGESLFDSVVVFENYPLEQGLREVGARLGEQGVHQMESTHYPLTLIVGPHAQIELAVGYDRALVDSATAALLAQHLRALLMQLLDECERPLASLQLAGELDTSALRAWNQTACALDPATLVHEQMSGTAQRMGESIALSQGAEVRSYRELERRSNQLAQRLLGLGVGPDVLVAIAAERSLALVEAVLAVLKAGGAYVPLDPDYPDERLRYMLEDSGATVVLAQRTLCTRLPELARAKLLVLEELDLAGESADAPQIALQPDNLAYVIYTSGSTGLPKGAGNTHGALRNRLRWMQAKFALTPADVVLHKTPFGFDVSVWELLWPLMVGARMELCAPGEQRDPGALLERIVAGSVTTLHFVPSMLQLFLEQPGVDGCSSLRRVFSSGEALSEGTAARLFEQLPQAELHNLYGPTEAAIDVTHWQRRAGDAGPVPIGHPISNLTVHVLDADLNPLPVLVPGELYLGGMGLARGYHARPALTAERFVPDAGGGEPGARLYRTGDLARRRVDGSIEYLGRLDHQVKLRGFRIELGEIEAQLRARPEVRDAVVLARRKGDAMHLVAYVVVQPNTQIAAIEQALRDALPAYMVPARFVVLAALPLTANGKLDRKALPEDLESDAARRRPSGALELRLAAIWQSVLARDELGANESFFQLGGDSISSLKVVARAQAAGLPLTIKALFEELTIERIAAWLGRQAPALARPALTCVARGTLHPVSHAQRRLWFLSQLDPDSSAYHISSTLTLHGALERGQLARSLERLVARHEALRTTFEERAGELHQRVHESLPPALRVLAAGEREQAEREARAPFDLQRGPLLRVVLLEGEQCQLVLWTMHHIVSDGASMAILLAELSTLLRAEREGRTAELPALPVQYVDYAAWQAQVLSESVLEAHLGYFRGVLAGEQTVLELPSDAVATTAGQQAAVVRGRLCDADARALRALAQSEGVTVSTVLLTVFKIWLYRQTGQTVLRVGLPVSLRDRPELEGVVGLFVNSLVIASEVAGELSFREYLARVRVSVLGAHAHRDLPFERLVDALQPTRELGHNPLFQVMYDHQQRSLGELEQALGMAVEELSQEQRSAQLALGLDTFELDDGALSYELTYASDKFSRARVETWSAQWLGLLQQILAEPTARIGSLASMTAVELAYVRGLQRVSGSSAPTPFVHETIDAWLPARGAEVALESGEQRWSYRELVERSNALAQRLRELGVGPEVRVGLAATRSPRMVLGALSVLKAGGAYVPLDPSYPRERLTRMMADAGIRVLLTENAVALAAAEGIETLLLEEQTSRRALAPRVVLHGESAAYVIYTSGSTGEPKGVTVSHAALAEHVHAVTESYELSASDVALHFASMSFDAGVEQWVGPLVRGAKLSIRPDELWTAEEALSELSLRGVTWFEMPPGYLRELADASLRTGQKLALRGYSAGGEALSRESLRVMLEAFAPAALWNGYGPTEAVVTPCVWRVSDADACTTSYAPIGEVVGARAAYVLDGDLNLVSPGVTGELYLGGGLLARGYHGQPGLSAARFIPDAYSGQSGARLYRTGDLARLRDDGTLEYLGRADHQVKLRGFRVELGEVESALLSCANVREAVVVVHELGATRQLVAYVAGEALQGEGLRRALSARLPSYMVPAQLLVLGALPRNANGKVDRRKLPAPMLAESAYEAPESEHECALAQIWARVLGVPRVGRSANFFELGGDSLKSLQVVSRAREAGLVLTPRALFEQQTLAGLAAVVESGVAESALPRVRRDGAHPLSHAQQRLWFLAELEPESAAYHIAGAVRLTGALDVAALEQALAKLVARHESLRTTFDDVEGVGVQRLHAALPLSMRHVDLTDVHLGQREQSARAAAEAEVLRSFDLRRGPLLRVALLKLGSSEHVLVLTLHHLVSDGGSLDVVIEELVSLYAAEHGGYEAELPVLRTQYLDYAAWQHTWLSEAELARQLGYWSRQLGSEHPLLELPADHARPARPSHHGASLQLELDAQVTASLRKLGQAHGATLYMVLLAAFQTLLHRLTGQRDVRVGVPVTNRERVESDRVVGLFVNTQVLRSELDPSEPFTKLLERVRQTALAAQAHRDLPFERLVEALAPARNLGHNPLFQVAFNHQAVPTPLPRSSAGLELSLLHWTGCIAQFDLTLDTEESACGALRGRLTYASELYTQARVCSWRDQLESLLRELARDGAQRIGALPLLSAADEQRLAGWEGEPTSYTLSFVHERIASVAHAQPGAIAVSCAEEQLTYAELEQRSNQLAQRLRRLGVGPDVLVGLSVSRTSAQVVGILGILKAGGAYVPLDPSYPAERLAYMRADAGLSLVVTEPAHAAELADVECVLLSELASEATTAPALRLSPDNLAYVIYTSGSTGRPKGARLTHGNVARLFAATEQTFHFDAKDVWTLFHSYAFDFSVWELFGALLHGGRLVVVPQALSRSPEELWELVQREQVTVLNQTPSAFRGLVDAAVSAVRAGSAASTSLRYVVFGGEALEPSSVRTWFGLYGDASPALVNMYGITETTVHVTERLLRAADLDDGEAPLTPIGCPLSDLSVRVLDRSLGRVAAGVAGELCVSGAGVAQGYHGRASLTAERFVPDPYGRPGSRMYRSGDVGRFRLTGELEYLGRSDEQVKIRGYRIELGEIAGALMLHPDVRAAVVVLRELRGDKRLVGYVVPARADVAVEVLREALREQLPEHMVPTQLMAIERIPLTVNGKLDREKLPEPSAARRERVAPRSELERRLCAIWQDVLGVDEIGVTDDFFELGGHSLLATRVMAKVRQELGFSLPLRELFDATSVERFAQRMDSQSSLSTGHLDAIDALMSELEGVSE